MNTLINTFTALIILGSFVMLGAFAKQGKGFKDGIIKHVAPKSLTVSVKPAMINRSPAVLKKVRG